MKLFFQVLTKHPRHDRLQWSTNLTEERLKLLLQQNRIRADDRVRYADDEDEYGSVAELLEAISAPDARFFETAPGVYLDNHPESDSPPVPGGRKQPGARSVAVRLKDGFNRVRQHRNQTRQSSPAKPPAIILVTRAVARLFVLVAVWAGILSLSAYSQVESSRAMAAIGRQLRAEAWLYACISSACLAVFTFGWAFLLQTVWEIRQSRQHTLD